jgi:hypothetical protein
MGRSAGKGHRRGNERSRWWLVESCELPELSKHMDNKVDNWGERRCRGRASSGRGGGAALFPQPATLVAHVSVATVRSPRPEIRSLRPVELALWPARVVAPLWKTFESVEVHTTFVRSR